MAVSGRKKIILSLVEDLFINDDLVNMIFTFIEDKNNTNVLFFYFKPNMPIKIFKTERWLEEYDNYQFYGLFRLRKTTFFTFVNIIRRKDRNRILSKPYTGGHVPLDIVGHCLVFIWYMATQDTLITIGTIFNVCPQTVMNVVNRLLYFVLLLKYTYIRMPQNEAELQAIEDGFSNYPGVGGVIDGTHIFLKVEKENQESYIDRYRRHSINIMAICDSNRLFTYIFAGFPGSAHDARVFQNSTLYQNIQRQGPERYFRNRFHLIGDSAFTLRTWLITPFRGNNLTRVERYHNECLSKSRVVIEHSFGILKGRWRRVQFINTYNIFKAIEIATASCIMHNFCLLHADDWEEVFEEEDEFQPGDDGRENFDARVKRNEIAYMLFNRRE